MYNDNLPSVCYSRLRTDNSIIIIKNGDSGYYPTSIKANSKEEAQTIVKEHNLALGVSEAEQKAMEIGSMFGWDVPGADPKNYM